MNTIPLSLRNEPGIRECIRHVMKEDAAAGKNKKPPTPIITQATNKMSQQVVVQQQQHQQISSTSHYASTTPTGGISSVVASFQQASSTAAVAKKKAEERANEAYYKGHYARAERVLCLQTYYYGRKEGIAGVGQDNVMQMPSNLKVRRKNLWDSIYFC